MPTGPAARILDSVVHPTPPMLTGGPGSLTVLIGGMPAWRGLPLAMVAALQANKAASTARVTAAKGTPAGPGVEAAEMAAMSALITAMAAVGADVHACVLHGAGVVITGSATVMINNMPACRLGDQILEALGPPNVIVKGQMNVIIGG